MVDRRRQVDEWLTVQEICEHLKVSDQTVRRWIKAGDLPATNLGGKAGYRVRSADLQAFLQQRREGKAAA